MGSLFGGGGKSDALQWEAMRREDVATKKADDLVAKNQAETDKLKAEEDTTKKNLEDRRRRVASGQIGRQSLFTGGELGYTRTLGAT